MKVKDLADALSYQAKLNPDAEVILHNDAYCTSDVLDFDEVFVGDSTGNVYIGYSCTDCGDNTTTCLHEIVESSRFLWNQACDTAIGEILDADASRFANIRAEEIYAKLKLEIQQRLEKEAKVMAEYLERRARSSCGVGKSDTINE